MLRSETITKISAAMVKAQSEMSNAKKDAVNPFFKKSYADLNAIREAVLPVLNKHGISAIQPTCVVDGKNFVETILLHESGEFISSLTEIVVDKVNDAQRHGSGLSYARRYALQSIVNIGAEDDDANTAVGQPLTHQPAPAKQSKKSASAIDPAEVPHYIDRLQLCETVKDLQDLKKLAPAYVVEDASFIDAAKKRYEVVMATPVK